eukprot:1454094-Rhodomonas_salina.5
MAMSPAHAKCSSTQLGLGLMHRQIAICFGSQEQPSRTLCLGTGNSAEPRSKRCATLQFDVGFENHFSCHL